MTERTTDVNYVYDALREHLPSEFSLTREEGKAWDGTKSARYKWTNWLTGQYMICEVHEGYASEKTVDQLCLDLTQAVLQEFGVVHPWTLRNN